MKGRLRILAPTAAILIAGIARAAGHESLCPDSAHVIFSCPSTGGEISVCRVSEGSKSQSAIVYKFGRSADTAFSLPARLNGNGRVDSPEAVHVLARTLIYSGGGGAYLRFMNKNTNYIVFSKFVNGSESQGVVVYKDGRTSIVKYCLRHAISTMNLRLFRDLGVANDPDEFVFP